MVHSDRRWKAAMTGPSRSAAVIRSGAAHGLEMLIGREPLRERGGASRQKVVRFEQPHNSAAHSRASGIFPASLKASGFAKAWLSADRSAADSLPDRVPRALRAAADMLRIGTVQRSNPVSAGDKSRPPAPRSQRLSVPASSRWGCRECRKRSKPNSRACK
jgi:hypothetical protein